jgi:hypothetical protein
MRVTFTGTRNGMTPAQLRSAMNVFRDLSAMGQQVILLHGACHGADRQAHPLIPLREMYPSNDEQWDWASNNAKESDVVYAIDEPIRRNRRMVDSSDIVVAAPKGIHEEHRGSGTWATMRYARRKHRPLYTLWFDGSISFDLNK